MPREKSADVRVHTGVRLDAKILERLSAGDRGVSDQIRERLERTFAEDDLDATTRELREFIASIASVLRADFGCEWHEYPRVHQAFSAAVAQRIAAYKPPARELPVAASDLLYFGPDDAPETIGRMRERDDRRAHAYPKLEAAEKRTAPRLARKLKGE